jgi:hypothetical protein
MRKGCHETDFHRNTLTDVKNRVQKGGFSICRARDPADEATVVL